MLSGQCARVDPSRSLQHEDAGESYDVRGPGGTKMVVEAAGRMNGYSRSDRGAGGRQSD